LIRLAYGVVKKDKEGWPVLSIRGIYTGKEIKPLEDIHVRSNIQVIITFLEDEPVETKDKKRAEETPATSKDPTEVFLEKCGGWEDTRTPEEIIAEIYTSRTTSERGVQLFQEHA
jgi:hypothetical protein